MKPFIEMTEDELASQLMMGAVENKEEDKESMWESKDKPLGKPPKDSALAIKLMIDICPADKQEDVLGKFMKHTTNRNIDSISTLKEFVDEMSSGDRDKLRRLLS